MAHELIFENGTPIDVYTACAVAEGFCEGENASPVDRVKAWSFIQGTKMYVHLQGFYGRVCRDMINAGTFDPEGTVNWELVNETLNNR